MNSGKAKVIVRMDGYAGVNVFTVADDSDKASSTELQDEWQRMKGKREKILKDTLYVMVIPNLPYSLE
ncbi:hypothetical protein AAVH_23764 [Aphelenchoides avenae]|nr:hypothetical protein AAVH_23764 [Aphelenchus avenae]